MCTAEQLNLFIAPPEDQSSNDDENQDIVRVRGTVIRLHDDNGCGIKCPGERSQGKTVKKKVSHG
jgi:hypothetical protein